MTEHQLACGVVYTEARDALVMVQVVLAPVATPGRLRSADDARSLTICPGDDGFMLIRVLLSSSLWIVSNTSRTAPI